MNVLNSLDTQQAPFSVYLSINMECLNEPRMSPEGHKQCDAQSVTFQ